MATKRSRPKPGGADVDAFLASLTHPRKDAIERIRAIVRDLDPEIIEEIKWNAPSFALGEHFATFQLRQKKGVMLIMHFGAKKRAAPPNRSEIADPTKLLTWLADDRATITFEDLADVEAKRQAFIAIAHAWIAALKG